MGRLAALGALVGALLASAARAGAAGGEDGAAAPQGVWSVDGGCAARTNHALTPALVPPVERAWEFTTKDPIRIGPLVYEDWALVTTTGKAGYEAIEILSVETGKPIARKVFKTDAPLHVALARSGAIVVVVNGTQLEGYRKIGTSVNRFWKPGSSPAIHDLLVHGHEVYVRSMEGICRYAIGSRGPVWNSPGDYRGTLALRGEQVYALQYDGNGNGYLVWISRDRGMIGGKQFVGHHSGKVPHRATPIPIQVFGRSIVVRHVLPIGTESGGVANRAVLTRTVVGGRLVAAPSTVNLGDGDMIAAGDGWVGSVVIPGGGFELIEDDGGPRNYVLASRTDHPAFAAGPLSGSRAADTVLFGHRAVAASTWEILWAAPEEFTGQPVPADGRILFRQGATTVVAMRGGVRPVAMAWIAPQSDGEPEAFAGRACLQDGTVAEGRVRVDAARSEVTVESGSRTETWPAAEVLAVEDDQGVLRLARPGAGARRGLSLFARRDRARAFAQLALQAGLAQDLELLETLLDEAATAGATPSEMKSAEEHLKRLVKRKSPATPVEAKSAKIRAESAALDAGVTEFYWSRARTLRPGAPVTLWIDLLREVVDLEPAHAEVAEAIRARLPQGVQPKSPFPAHEWLDYLDAVQVTPVEVVPRPSPSDPDLTQGERTLGMMLGTWRPDLVGTRSEQVLVISTVDRPGALARTLAMAELVCGELDSWFREGPRVRKLTQRMTVLLYGTEEEYKKYCAAQELETGHDLGWTAGHYTHSEELSRLFVPTDEDGFRRVMNVFAHELTHQWVAERCPRVPVGASPSREGGGHWIVEGFAKLVEEMRWDLRGRGASFDPHAQSLDITRQIPQGKLVPWKDLFEMDAARFYKCGKEPDVRVSLTRRLGLSRTLNEIARAYSQSAAVAMYLFHAQDGKHRQALLDYMVGYEIGEPLTIDAAFGMSAEVLGLRTVEWARSLD